LNSRIRTSLIYLVTAVVSFFFGLFVLDQIILPRIAGGARLVEVPNLEGVHLNQAKTLCRENGLILSVRGETYHAEVPADHILKQDPEPGVVVKQGRTIYVLLSMGPEIVNVPHVVGLTLRQATLLIENSQLVLEEIHREQDPEVPSGRVIKIDPPPGTELPRGAKVTLTVSEGLPQVLVPSVIDKTLEEAEKILSASGLSVGSVSYKYNRYLPAGRIIDQQPLERSQVPRGTRVDLIISSREP